MSIKELIKLIDSGIHPKNALEQLNIDKNSLSKESLKKLINRYKDNSFNIFAKSIWPNFIDGWFYKHLFDNLNQFYNDFIDNKRPKLKLSVPPRHGKSETIIRLCLYAMKKSQTEIIFTTYSQEQANRISEKARRLACDLAIYKSGGKREWETTNRSVFRSVGRGGGLTGTGADLLVLDDMIKNSEEADSQVIREKLWDFYLTTAETRLSPRGSQLAIGTRWHKADLIGRLTDPSWIDISYPAIAEIDEEYRKEGEELHSRFPISHLLDIKSRIPARFWSALYQRRPVNIESAIVKQINKVSSSMLTINGYDIISIDCTFKGTKNSDFNAIQRWKIAWPHCYCLEAYNIKAGFSLLLETLSMIIKGNEVAILVEDKANGSAIIEKLREKHPNVLPINPTESKYARFQACSPMFESGNVHFLDSIACLPDVEEQMLNFPLTEHDDQVDACSQALNWARSKNQSLGTIETINPWWG